eukprot:1643618-Amphidinium_carterae.1
MSVVQRQTKNKPISKEIDSVTQDGFTRSAYLKVVEKTCFPNPQKLRALEKPARPFSHPASKDMSKE